MIRKNDPNNDGHTDMGPGKCISSKSFNLDGH